MQSTRALSLCLKESKVPSVLGPIACAVPYLYAFGDPLKFDGVVTCSCLCI